MAYTNTIGILIAAKDEASVVIDKAAINTRAASAEVNNLGSSATATGSMLKTGLVLALVATAGESANLAIKFQQSMEMLHTNAGVAKEDIAGLSQQILDMAGSVGQGPDQLAQAFYHIASAGTGLWTTAKEMDILKVAAEGAAIGQANLDDTTYALTSAMSSNIGGVKSAAEMMAVLNATVGAGDMKLQDLNGALSTGILSTAATFGISIQSVGTALATLTDNGEHADEAATRLRMTFALMSSPSSMAAKQLEALGLTAEDAKNATSDMNAVFVKSGLTTTKLADDLRQPNGIATAIEDLKTHLHDAGLSASEADAMLSKAFGGGRTDAALLTLLQNTDRLDEKFKVINKNAGEFGQNFADQQTTAAQKIKDVWAGIQAVFVRVGDWLGKVADKAMQDLAPAFQFIGMIWQKYVQPAFDRVLGANGQKIIDFFGGALAAAIVLVVGPLLLLAAVFVEAIMTIDKVVQTFQAVMDKVKLGVATAVITVKQWWANLQQGTKEAWEKFTLTISNAWQKVTTTFSNAVGAIGKFIMNLPSEVGFAIGWLAGILVNFATVQVPGFVKNVVSWFQKLPSEIGKAVQDMWNTVTSWFSKTGQDAQKHAQDTVNGATTEVKKLPGQIGDIISGMWNSVVSFFTNFGTNVSNWAKKTVQDAIDQFTKLPGEVGNAISGAWNNATGGISKGWNDFVSGITKGFNTANHHALGTNFAPGGMTVVGENGPELVNLPTGSKVHTARETQQMASQSGKGVTINGGLHVHNEMDEQRILRNLGWRLANA